MHKRSAYGLKYAILSLLNTDQLVFLVRVMKISESLSLLQHSRAVKCESPLSRRHNKSLAVFFKSPVLRHCR